jgi:diaminopimelate epimerase
MQIAFIKCHGSGNDFPLVDARHVARSDADWSAIARLLADRNGPVGGDGLLALTSGDAGHAFGFRMWNSDGSEAETCLNGLRCAARLGFELLGIDAARVRLRTSSAEVARVAELAPGVATVRTRVGPAGAGEAAVGLTGPLSGVPTARELTAVSMPNPHLVAFVETIDEAELVALGEWCEAGPALIPARANVSFVELRNSDLFVRTYERGVGLTDSCGSAMAASVFAAGLTARIPFGTETRVLNKGGLVLASATAPEDGAEVTIAGNATFLYDATIELDLAGHTAAAPLIVARREAEAAAWAAAIA